VAHGPDELVGWDTPASSDWKRGVRQTNGLHIRGDHARQLYTVCRVVQQREIAILSMWLDLDLI
jgi:hypothetical protein